MTSTWALSSSAEWWLREFWAVRTDRILTEADKARGLVQSLCRRNAEAVRDAIDEQERIEEGTT
jgi:hypothetical protein